MSFQQIQLGRAVPGASSRIELCHDRAKTTVWLQLTKAAFVIGDPSPVFVTCLIGAIQKQNRWTAIDAGTAARLRDVTLAFGTRMGAHIGGFQNAILTRWQGFSHDKAAEFANWRTVGADLSNPSFVMAAIKMGFDAIGVSVPAHSGLQLRGFTVDDTIAYLESRATVVGASVLDGALLDFSEIGPDPSLAAFEDEARMTDKRDIPCIESNKADRHSNIFAYAELTASVPFPRVVTYGFRGDSRTPSAIKNAGGFNPNYTRPDHIAKAEKKVGQEHDQALNITKFIADQTYGGYISVSKSYAVTKAFATGMGGTTGGKTSFWSKKRERAAGWVYVCFVEGGFNLPPVDKPIGGVTVKFDEQEISMPGSLDWEDVVACRRVSANGNFEGNIFMRQSMALEDPKASVAIWKLLSGETQGYRARR